MESIILNQLPKGFRKEGINTVPCFNFLVSMLNLINIITFFPNVVWQIANIQITIQNHRLLVL